MNEIQPNVSILRLIKLGPALAKIFVFSFARRRLSDYPDDFKSAFCGRYVDGIFALFSSPDHAGKFKEYLYSKHLKIDFSIEKEKNECLPFLDVKIFCENGKFTTNALIRPSVEFTPTSKFLYLKIKLV